MDFSRTYDRVAGLYLEVVAVQGDIQRAHRNGSIFNLSERFGDALGQVDTPAANTHYDNPVDAKIALHDFVGDPFDRAADLVGVHDAGLGPESQIHPSEEGFGVRGMAAGGQKNPAGVCGRE